MTRKQTIWGLTFVVFISLFTYVGIPFGRQMLQLATGYAAKYVCSHVFVSDFSQEEAERHITIWPITKTKVKVDSENKSVSATLWGMVPRTAYYYQKGEMCGCVLDKEVDQNEIPEVLAGTRMDTIWPLGDQLSDSIQALIPQSELKETLDQFIQVNPEVHAITVAHENGALIESYRADIEPKTRLLGWSMTKSFQSVLFGILEKADALELDQPLPLKDLESGGDPITFRHALQMNTGREWDENYFSISPSTRMLYFSENVSTVPLASKAEARPGESWEYSSGTTNMLSHVLRKIKGKDYHSFIHNKFFDRIGMHSAVVETDLSGHYVMSSYGWATARDWTRLGLLFLRKGDWFGDTLFTPKWHEFITQESPTSKGHYGGHVWLNQGGEYPDVPESAYFADGFGNQRVLVVPSHQVAISVLTGHAPEVDLNGLFAKVLSQLTPTE